VGTSAIIYPAAGLPAAAAEAGAFLVEVNPEPTPLSELCDVVLRGPAGAILPLLDV
jgi:NAD-dependent deacetylase